METDRAPAISGARVGRMCGKSIGDTPRFLHVGVCVDCAQAPKH